MSDHEINYTEGDVIGAIRLALVGADNDETALALIRSIVEAADPTPPHNTLAARLLFDALDGTDLVISSPGAESEES